MLETIISYVGVQIILYRMFPEDSWPRKYYRPIAYRFLSSGGCGVGPVGGAIAPPKC